MNRNKPKKLLRCGFVGKKDKKNSRKNEVPSKQVKCIFEKPLTETNNQVGVAVVIDVEDILTTCPDHVLLHEQVVDRLLQSTALRWFFGVLI